MCPDTVRSSTPPTATQEPSAPPLPAALPALWLPLRLQGYVPEVRAGQHGEGGKEPQGDRSLQEAALATFLPSPPCTSSCGLPTQLLGGACKYWSPGGPGVSFITKPRRCLLPSNPLGRALSPFFPPHQDSWPGVFEASCPPEATSDCLTNPVQSAITADGTCPVFCMPITTDFPHRSTSGLLLGIPNRTPCPPSYSLSI